MTSAAVIVYPPGEVGGRRVSVNGAVLGLAFSAADVAALLETAGMQGFDEMDVVRARGIEWRGGGPEVWTH
ncbi:hypothetical protein [Streptomyces sp. NPDC055085]